MSLYCLPSPQVVQWCLKASGDYEKERKGLGTLPHETGTALFYIFRFLNISQSLLKKGVLALNLKKKKNSQRNNPNYKNNYES